MIPTNARLHWILALGVAILGGLIGFPEGPLAAAFGALLGGIVGLLAGRVALETYG